MRKPFSVAYTTLVASCLTSLLLGTVQSRDCQTSWRRAWRDLTCDEQDEFLEAILRLKESGLYDEFRHTHQYYGDLTHGTPEFLPWHRWFIWQFEKALQHVTGKCIYVPYWDSERDATRENQSPVFHADTFGTFGKVLEGTNCTADGRFNSTPNSLFEHTSYYAEGIKMDCLQRTYNQEIQFSGESQVLGIIASFEQYGDSTDPNDDDAANGFRSILEGLPHAFPHLLVGGHMTTDYSPDDPLFYVHHSNIDRLWSLWQDYHDHDEVNYDDFDVPWHYEGDLLDEPLPFELEEVSWDFRMEWDDVNAVGEWFSGRSYPTPRDLMSNHQPYMSVRYVNDYLSSLLVDYEANPRWFQVATGDVFVRCERGERRSLHAQQLDFSSNLRGTSLRRNDVRPILPQNCGQRNKFTRIEDQERWLHLCQTLPMNTTISDRFVYMASADCDERWRQLNFATGNTTVERATQRWIKEMGKMNQQAAFACFHKPDP